MQAKQSGLLRYQIILVWSGLMFSKFINKNFDYSGLLKVNIMLGL